ncbi:MAG: BRCT domain-containing protein [Myxococcales bacterium]|nr:BRCT domain-containing protein [Myxococcales bacterium]
MKISVWNSFSCNNSSSYRLVARFSSEKLAAESAAQLREFFVAHAVETDQSFEDDSFDYNKPTQVALDFAKKHKFKWKGYLGWGDCGLVDDEPHVVTTGSTLVLWHSYCGGFGDGVPAYLKKRGAKVEKESRDAPSIAVRFTLPAGKAGDKLASELAAYFAQAQQEEYIGDWPEGPPWKGDNVYEESSTVAWAQDGTSFAFDMPIDARDLPALKTYLEKKKVSDLSMSLCDAKQGKAIRQMAQRAAANTADVDASSLAVEGKKFLFTGKLATLSRADAKKRVAEIGGTIAGSVSKDLDYLVVGDEGSPLFGEGAKGSKLLAAEKLQKQGAGLQIISENTFLKLQRGGGAPATAKKKVAKKAAAKATPKKAPSKATAKKATKKKASSTGAGGRTTVGKKFLFTGKLASMTRSEAKTRVADLGGVSAGSVSKDLDYLVIGDEGSPLFGEGKKGSKMVAAEKLIAAGASLVIISETDFLQLAKK